MTNNIKSKSKSKINIKKCYKYGKMKPHLDELQEKTDEYTALKLDAKEKYVRLDAWVTSLMIHQHPPKVMCQYQIVS